MFRRVMNKFGGTYILLGHFQIRSNLNGRIRIRSILKLIRQRGP